ncbi:hydantoinase/oxoprolinase family protein [Conexibacter sp. CPCC 206217]|uniref:hydantoinase/oxoprolinase family protein n=1 Tax=Conexibacter sp. CPCC 206217 TaxID=3064574 RepID=UPI002717DCE4|nr:hydantoinase/oxoprolinase family protein [Conexibacter sp. CPCC 206217]MDO8210167.1 hydantoinase/oxoprolinase family protein [Conexibacter sp. CPCC 206217]
MSGYRVGVDTGGTFTDLVSIDADGAIAIHKVPSRPDAPSQTMLAGLAGLAAKAGLEPADFLRRCETIVHGTTVPLNTVIQQRGARTALLTTAGHEDAIEIRLGHKEDGHRWDFAYPQATPLVPAARRLGVPERVLADGTVLQPLDEARLEQLIDRLVEERVEAVAVSCLWSFNRPEHELRIAERLRARLPGAYVSTSVEALPRIGEYTRTSTTVLNAYVGPRLRAYMADLESGLLDAGFAGSIFYMQSNGGVATRAVLERRPVAAISSGPAAGPTAALHFAAVIGSEDVISVDMGGTSFDICLVHGGRPDVVSDVDVDRYRVGLPMVNVTSIGAGGGSIAHIDARGLLQVGPQSAEAFPGPACYRRGGERPTVTDALVTLGYLSGEALLGGRLEIDPALAAQAIERDVVSAIGGTVADAAQGILELAIRSMADGIEIASVGRGHDPRDFTLLAGGAAGPTFGGLLGQELGIADVLVPKVAGVLCAFGDTLAELRYDVVRSCPGALDALEQATVERLFAEMALEGREALGLPAGADVRLERVAEMKYVDQVHYCDVPVPDAPDGGLLDALAEAFHARHRQLYAYAEPDNRAELLSLRLSVVAAHSAGAVRIGGGRTSAEPTAPAAAGHRQLLLRGAQRPVAVPIHDGAAFPVGASAAGPLIVEEETTTIFVPPRARIALIEGGMYLIHTQDPSPAGDDSPPLLAGVAGPVTSLTPQMTR